MAKENNSFLNKKVLQFQYLINQLQIRQRIDFIRKLAKILLNTFSLLTLDANTCETI